MAGRVCTPCRNLLRRQARLLGRLSQMPLTWSAAVARAPVAEAKAEAGALRISRRHFHQTPNVASLLTNLTKKAVLPYKIFGSSLNLLEACSKPVAYKVSKEDRERGALKTTEDGEEIGVGGGVWHDDFGLLPTFSTWSQVTILHMYLLVVRLRCLDQEAWQEWQSQLVDHFFRHAEDMMEKNHAVKSRSVRNKYLKELLLTWRGAVLAYDEGLVKGDAVLAAAVWRNLYNGQEDVDLRKLAAIVSWMRQTLKALDRMQDQQVLYYGASVFRTPSTREFGFGQVDKSTTSKEPTEREAPKQSNASTNQTTSPRQGK